MKRYLLLANQGQAALFEEEVRNNKRKALFLKKTFKSEVGDKKESDIFTHKAGSHATNHTHDHATVAESHYLDEKASQFSKSIIDYLDKHIQSEQIESLVIVSGPAFLGKMRKKIGTSVQQHISKEVSKNFYTEKKHELSKFMESHHI